MSESTELHIDLLKPHVQAILDEVRRAGPEACRAAQYEVEARLPEELRLARDAGSPSCAGLHVLAAVALQISIDMTLAGEDGAIDVLLESFQYQQAAADCEAAASASNP